MTKVHTWAGLDVHAASTVACVVDALSGEMGVHRLAGKTSEVVSFCLRLPAPVSAAYEAGPTGFELARALDAAGVACVVAAPGKIERLAQDRVKTDRRDAERLVRLLMIGGLYAVRVPSSEEEALRDLVRAREDIRGDLMRSRHRLSKLLLRHDVRYEDSASAWTAAHRAWLSRVDLGERAAQATLLDYLGAVDALVMRRDTIERMIAELVPHSPWADQVARLRCLRGFDTLTAVGLCAEIGDFTRFERPAQLMSYLGLVPQRLSPATTAAVIALDEELVLPLGAGAVSGAEVRGRYLIRTRPRRHGLDDSQSTHPRRALRFRAQAPPRRLGRVPRHLVALLSSECIPELAHATPVTSEDESAVVSIRLTNSDCHVSAGLRYGCTRELASALFVAKEGGVMKSSFPLCLAAMLVGVSATATALASGTSTIAINAPASVTPQTTFRITVTGSVTVPANAVSVWWGDKPCATTVSAESKQRGSAGLGTTSESGRFSLKVGVGASVYETEGLQPTSPQYLCAYVITKGQYGQVPAAHTQHEYTAR